MNIYSCKLMLDYQPSESNLEIVTACISWNQTLEKSKRGSGKLAEVEVYTVPGMQAHFRLAID